jgi:hypothetical protein
MGRKRLTRQYCQRPTAIVIKAQITVNAKVWINGLSQSPA